MGADRCVETICANGFSDHMLQRASIRDKLLVFEKLCCFLSPAPIHMVYRLGVQVQYPAFQLGGAGVGKGLREVLGKRMEQRGKNQGENLGGLSIMTGSDNGGLH